MSDIITVNNDNIYTIALEQHEINQLLELKEGCPIEINMGNEIDLLGGNTLKLSSDLIIKVVLINDIFISNE